MQRSIGLGMTAAMLMLSASACRTDVTVIELSKPPTSAADPSILVAGEAHACVLVSDGTVRCWGSNAWGQLGTGNYVDALRPVAVEGLSGVRQIAASGNTTCALLNDGTVRCWGDNSMCQLGSDTEETGPFNAPRTAETIDRAAVWPRAVAVPGVGNVVRLAMSRTQQCGLSSDGTVRCWGRSYTTVDHMNPTRAQLCESSTVSVPTLSDVVSLSGSANDGSMCAVRSNGTVACWGIAYGGVAPWATPLTPPAPPLGFGTLAGAADARFARVIDADRSAPALDTLCVLMADGTVQCRGQNTVGLLGDGTTTSRLSFSAVPGLRDVVRLHIRDQRVCAQQSTGSVSCWGVTPFFTPEEQHTANPDLCPTTGNSMPCSLVPRAISELTGVRDFATGSSFSCAYLDDGTVRCKGYNAFGQLGDESRTNNVTGWSVVRF